jgi:hypothetical protein
VNTVAREGLLLCRLVYAQLSLGTSVPDTVNECHCRTALGRKLSGLDENGIEAPQRLLSPILRGLGTLQAGTGAFDPPGQVDPLPWGCKSPKRTSVLEEARPIHGRPRGEDNHPRIGRFPRRGTSRDRSACGDERLGREKYVRPTPRGMTSILFGLVGHLLTTIVSLLFSFTSCPPALALLGHGLNRPLKFYSDNYSNNIEKNNLLYTEHDRYGRQLENTSEDTATI